MNVQENKTKIVCTIGPSSWDPGIMRQMIQAGMDCARVNGAFADSSEMDKVKDLVRSISDSVSLMLDVNGQEIRLNKFDQSIPIEKAQKIVIGSNPKDDIFPVNYLDLYKYVDVGQRIYINGNDVELIVTAVEDGNIVCKVVSGDMLQPSKIINLPGCDYPSEVLTEQDKEKLRHAVVSGWDFVSPSYIEDAKSAVLVRNFIKGSNMKIIAKIENLKGIENIEEILEIVDGIMFSKEHLKTELGEAPANVYQKRLIRKCNEAGKPIIIATEILEASSDNPVPTKAESSDVSEAIIDGADAILLSAESASGHFPVESVEAIAQIARETESKVEPKVISSRPVGASISADALTKAAASICIEMEHHVDKVVVVSKSGRTARVLARHGISQPIFAFVSKDSLARTLLLTKNISKAFQQEALDDNRDNAVNHILERAKQLGILQVNEVVLLICKTPIDGDNYFPNIFEILSVR